MYVYAYNQYIYVCMCVYNIICMHMCTYIRIYWLASSGRVKGFPGGSVVEDLPANATDLRLIPGLVRSPGEGNGSPLQYLCLENSIDKRS